MGSTSAKARRATGTSQRREDRQPRHPAADIGSQCDVPSTKTAVSSQEGAAVFSLVWGRLEACLIYQGRPVFLPPPSAGEGARIQNRELHCTAPLPHARRRIRLFFAWVMR